MRGLIVLALIALMAGQHQVPPAILPYPARVEKVDENVLFIMPLYQWGGLRK